MSLLMEALKRAEESQNQTVGDEPSHEVPSLELEPLSSQPAGAGPTVLSGLPDDDLSLAAGLAEPPKRAHDETASERALARRLFAAKKTRGPSLAFWITLAVLLVMASVAVFHFWRQYKLITGNSLTRPLVSSAPRPMPLPPVSQTVVPSAPPLAQANLLPATQAPLPSVAPNVSQVSPPPAVASAASEPLPSLPVHPPTASRPIFSAASPVESGGLSAPTSRLSAARAAESPIRLSRDRSGVDPKLEKAYDLLQAGRPGEALPHYEAVLRSDPENIDALLGLATIAGKSGQREHAYAYYRRAIEIDPKDPTALAGLINERGLPDPALSESRLKSALSAQPGSPALLFAMGNLYAKQNRWSEAQQAYFNAYAIDPGNADYAFNLAVSLDHLNQTNLAVRYYETALRGALGNSRAFAFDENQAKNRVLELTSHSGVRAPALAP
ncbi:MAG: tetratricopeptide repeat protein [Candidatus Accumulibacter sp.]|jgi:Tfp pilus assembly protein PilF|nr:tetratricopeptide repeat protein [Accumulibacter sp.]